MVGECAASLALLLLFTRLALSFSTAFERAREQKANAHKHTLGTKKTTHTHNRTFALSLSHTHTHTRTRTRTRTRTQTNAFHQSANAPATISPSHSTCQPTDPPTQRRPERPCREGQHREADGRATRERRADRDDEAPRHHEPGFDLKNLCNRAPNLLLLIPSILDSGLCTEKQGWPTTCDIYIRLLHRHFWLRSAYLTVCDTLQAVDVVERSTADPNVMSFLKETVPLWTPVVAGVASRSDFFRF